MKKSQVYYAEFIAAILIISAVLIIYVKYAPSITETQELDELLGEGKRITNSLISEGYPANWTATSVNNIGITNNNHRVNNSKLTEFANMNYNTTRFILGLKYQYYMVLIAKDGSIINPVPGVEGIGMPGITISNIRNNPNIKELIKVDRYLVMDSDLVRMEVYVWRM